MLFLWGEKKEKNSTLMIIHKHNKNYNLLCQNMTFAFWCRCTPCPMFSTPNLPFSNKSSCTTRIANNTLVCVRFMLKAGYFCVAHFRRVLTHRSCKKYNNFRMLRFRKTNWHLKAVVCLCDRQPNLHKQGCVRSSRYSCSVWLQVPQAWT